MPRGRDGHVNRLGSVIAMVSETGTVSDHYIYTPFGIEEPLVGSGNPFRYTGRENRGQVPI